MGQENSGGRRGNFSLVTVQARCRGPIQGERWTRRRWVCRMRAVKPGHPRRGNPGASLYWCHRARRACAANVAAGASTLCERHAAGGRADCTDSARRPPAAAGGDSRWSTLGCNTSDHGRTGSTAAPGRGTARTGTGGLNGPCPPRASSQRVLDGRVPGCNTAAAPPSLARCRARRGTRASRRQ